MREFLNEIRRPINISLVKGFLYSALIFVLGVALGVLSKKLDCTASNSLPIFLEVLDLRNFFSRMGVWLFFGVLISVFSKSPTRAAINILLFFIGMVGSYYLYTIFIAGFFPGSYMMIWITMTVISPFLAFICWYARGEGIVAVSISSIIIMLISRQTFAFGFWYFDIVNILELLVWIATIFVLYKSPKRAISITTIGFLLYLLTSQIHLFWGML